MASDLGGCAEQLVDHGEQRRQLHRLAEHTVGPAHALVRSEVGLTIVLEQPVVAGDHHQRQVNRAAWPDLGGFLAALDPDEKVSGRFSQRLELVDVPWMLLRQYLLVPLLAGHDCARTGTSSPVARFSAINCRNRLPTGTGALR